jgi:hypothetical protein
MKSQTLTPKYIKSKLASLHVQQKDIAAQIHDLQQRCIHQWKSLQFWNDWDEWSIMEYTNYEDRVCEICGKVDTIELGKSLSH